MRRALGVLAAVALTTPALSIPVLIAPAAHAATPVTLANTVKLSGCSGSLVRYPTSIGTDRALVLTNGHCLATPTNPNQGQAFVDMASTRTGELLSSTGATLGTVTAERLVYATMTGTDIAIYRLNESFDALQTRLGGTPYTISTTGPSAGDEIGIPSSYWKRIYDCSVDGFANLREDQWSWTDSIRYNVGCETIHGTSGSPIVSDTTGQIVGINNTTNDNGAMCTSNNPCEVAVDGTTTADHHRGYGQQTSWITTCVNASRVFDLNVPGCKLAGAYVDGTFENSLASWTAGKGAVSGSAVQAHSGARSYLQDQDEDVAYVAFSSPKNKVVTLWFYDTPADKTVKAMARVDGEVWSGGTAWRGMGVDTTQSEDFYVYRIGATRYTTSVQRTAGWHRLKWDYTSGTGVAMYIDGQFIVNPSGVTQFNQISMGDWWLDSRTGPVYWDDVEIS